MNRLAILVNHGKMPVFEQGCPDRFPIDAMHACAGVSTHLKFLIDWIYLGDYIYSPGDFVLFAGQVIGALFLATVLYLGFKKLDQWLSWRLDHGYSFFGLFWQA